MSETRLNFHLDKECISSNAFGKSAAATLSKGKAKRKVPKQTRKKVTKRNPVLSDSDTDDVVFVNSKTKRLPSTSPLHVNTPSYVSSDDESNPIDPSEYLSFSMKTDSQDEMNESITASPHIRNLLDDWDEEQISEDLESGGEICKENVPQKLFAQDGISSTNSGPDMVNNVGSFMGSPARKGIADSTVSPFKLPTERSVMDLQTASIKSKESSNGNLARVSGNADWQGLLPRSKSLPLTPKKTSESRLNRFSTIKEHQCNNEVQSCTKFPNVKYSPGIRRQFSRFVKSEGMSPSKKMNASPSKKSLEKLDPASACKNLFSSPLKSSGSPLKQITPVKKDSPKKSFRDVNGIYLDNFLTVIDFIRNSPVDYKLFLDEEKQTVENFQHLSLAAKKLYVRIFQRNLKWKRVDKLEYPDICDKEDMELYVKELSYANYLHLEDQLQEIEETLSLLNLDELQELCKAVKINTMKKSKADLVKALMESSKKQPTIGMLFNKSKESEGSSILLKKAKNLLGKW